MELVGTPDGPLFDEIGAFLRARLPPRRPSVKWYVSEDGPPWYDCPDCKVTWMSALNPGCRQVRGRIHECWAN
jgi:transposase